MSETELIHRCINRDPVAWAEFVRRYSPIICWAIRDRLKGWGYLYRDHDVDDVRQAVLLFLWEKNSLAAVKDHEKVAAWLVAVAGNAAVDHFRRRKAQIPPSAATVFEDMAEADTEASEDQAGAEQLLSEELETLPYREKMILKLNVLYGKKYREIARMMNMPVGSVSTALRNTKRLLKKRLEEKIKKNQNKTAMSCVYIAGGEK